MIEPWLVFMCCGTQMLSKVVAKGIDGRLAQLV